LILKAGGYPSFRTERVKGRIQKFKNGNYRINGDSHYISWCQSKTAQRNNNKYGVRVDEVGYSGMVYDVELPRNHVLWVRRNGKTCFSGNCRCTTVVVE
jgi:hypothetical protein